jgi:hypothetical protein
VVSEISRTWTLVQRALDGVEPQRQVRGPE